MTLPDSGSATRRRRFGAIALAVAIATGAAAAIVAPLERAITAAPSASHHVHHVAGAMRAYPTSAYVKAARALPGALATAVRRDLHISPARYLADSAAAVQGVTVVSTLKSHGVHVLGSRMNGTHLVVNIASAADRATVVAFGAQAIVGAPRVPNFSKQTFHTVSNTYGGEAYFYQDADQVSKGSNEGFRCSIGFNGYAVSNGAPQFATAGHCATTISGDAYPIALNKPAHAGGSGGVSSIPLGGMVSGEGGFGDHLDYGIVAEDPSHYTAVPALYTWGGGAGAPTSSTPLGITGQSAGIAGAALCKSGSTSGWTCGKILVVDSNQDVVDDNDHIQQVNSIVATTCLLPGDSGGGAVMGSAAVGIDSASDNISGTCTNPKDSGGGAAVSEFFPMVSNAGPYSVQGQQGTNWQLAIAVATPKLATASSQAVLPHTTPLAGTLATPNSASTVSLYLDGAATPTVTQSASNGTFSFPLTSYSLGKHTYSLVATSGYSKSSTVSGSFTLIVPPKPSTTGGLGDFNSDGKPDLVVRTTTGALWLFPGNGTGGYGTHVVLASSGWQSMTAIVSVGDMTGDGRPDIVARDAAGTLWLYPGDGAHSLQAPIQLGTAGQFAGMTAIQGVADFNGDGTADLVARDPSGTLWLYPGLLSGGVPSLGARVQIATGWQTMSSIVGVGDYTGDGFSDLLVRNSANALLLYPGTGSGTLGSPVQLSTGWSGYTIAAVGDFNHDGFVDFVARDSAGNMWLYPGTGIGTYGTRVKFATGWNGLTIVGSGSTIPRVTLPAQTGGLGDFNSDGKPDIVVRTTTGALWLFPGNGTGGYGTHVVIASSGWQSMTAITAGGDFTGDGRPDIVARDSAGTLWVYPGNGAHSLGARIELGTDGQFAGMTAIEGVADFDGDGRNDLVARDSSGALWLYPVTGDAVLGARTQIASGWQAMTSIVGAGDFNGDGFSDLLVTDSSGTLWLYPGTGTGMLGARTQVGTGFTGYTLAGVGDFNRDGYLDFIARDSSGTMWLYPGNGTGTYGTRVKFATGWNGLTIAGGGSTIQRVILPAQTGGVGDFNSDGNADIIVRTTTGALWLFPGNGKGGYGTHAVIAASGWQSMTAIVAVGDMTGDGHPDLVARDSAGTLWLYPGNGAHGLGARIELGTDGQFAGMTAIQGVADFTGDGRNDLVARDSSGTVLLYPVTGSGVLGSPTQLATGWQAMTSIVGIGDFNGDGFSDVLARDASGNLVLYPGTGAGSLGSAVQVSTGWSGYTIAAVGDFNRDGYLDLIARDSAGRMWLLRGNSAGTFSAKVQFATGWTGLTIAGDGGSIAAIPSS